MYSKMLIPLDGSDLSERAIVDARNIAQGTDCELILVQVARSPLGKVPVAEGAPIESERTALEVFSTAQAYLEKVVSRLKQDGCRTRFQVLEGDPADAIMDFADREKVDIIVMSTHGRSGLSRLLMGSVAEKVARETSYPVLLIKPMRAGGRGAVRAA
jgi:nucleotide-binding universal stress UspA family protein